MHLARPLCFEGILRHYITGSLWRTYEKGQCQLYGIQLPEGLHAHQRLETLLFTPSTKGTLRGLEGVPKTEDAPITPDLIQ